MHAAPAATQFHWMFQVQHFVINDVFHGKARNPGVIESAAHDDGIVSRIVMTEPVPGVVAAPGYLRPSQQAVKKSRVQVVENVLQIVVLALSALNALAAAHLAYQVGFLADILTANMPAIA